MIDRRKLLADDLIRHIRDVEGLRVASGSTKRIPEVVQRHQRMVDRLRPVIIEQLNELAEKGEISDKLVPGLSKGIGEGSVNIMGSLIRTLGHNLPKDVEAIVQEHLERKKLEQGKPLSQRKLRVRKHVDVVVKRPKRMRSRTNGLTKRNPRGRTTARRKK